MIVKFCDLNSWLEACVTTATNISAQFSPLLFDGVFLITSNNFSSIFSLEIRLCVVKQLHSPFFPVFSANMDVQPTTNGATPPILDLPVEMLRSIFDLLDLTTSICLGLTCKPLWEIHLHKYGKVPLNVNDLRLKLSYAYIANSPPHESIQSLLKTWMLPKYPYMRLLQEPYYRPDAPIRFLLKFVTERYDLQDDEDYCSKRMRTQ